MNITKIKSYAKINLALNVVGKTLSLHKIESIVAFVDLHDIILIKRIKSKKHIVSFGGKFSDNIIKKNTVFRLLEILDKQLAKTGYVLYDKLCLADIPIGCWVHR